MKKTLLPVIVLLFISTTIVYAQSGIGDVNDDSRVDVVDALLVARYFVGLNPSSFNQSAADVNCDSSIDIVDALLISQYYVGLISDLTCGNSTPVPTPDSTPASTVAGQVLFDDFNYTTSSDSTLRNFGWVARTGSGGPGAVNSTWASDYITFEDDYVGKVLKLTASTNGSTPIQSEFYINNKKFREGTYAASIWFNDSPDAGPDGDHIVETFFPIADWNDANNDTYCELDFEYLANGGWDSSGPTMWNTTWETSTDSVSSRMSGSLQGSYHLCIIQAVGNSVKYYLDNQLLTTHYDPYAVDGFMTINFNLWFIEDGFLASSENRRYTYKVDWVYFSKDKALTMEEIETAVEYFRSQSIVRTDTVQ